MPASIKAGVIPQPEIRVFNSADALFQAAAAEFVKSAASAIHDHGRFCVVLSGGSTPRSLYTLLAEGRSSIPWDKVFFFWGDERHVPPENPESNYGMTREALLSKVPVPQDNIFRMHGEEKDANVAAEQYERKLQDFFGLKAGEFPLFDLTLLGLGPEGHTASLFPGTAVMTERQRLVVANWVDESKGWRITLTLPVLNHSSEVLFLVSGPDKAAIVKKIFEHPEAGLPAQLIRPVAGRVVWMLGREAAAELEPARR